MTIISDALQAIQAKMHAAMRDAGRKDEITLIAVSKAQQAEKIRQAYLAGQTHFGENYLQEALQKQSELSDCNIIWHYIGGIQSNKCAIIASHFDWVHTVDRPKIAQKLAEARPSNVPPLNVCIQVNVSQEASKNGVELGDIGTLARLISTLPTLKLRGLMTIPAPTKQVAKQREQFRMLKTQLSRLQQQGFDVETLSMGMSDDFEAAILEGATMVRIGSAIFGARQS